ncbi:MAG: NADH:ubiquinone oxidoreductase, partial [Candidatus Latescibacteria bacterium]|nr:NADH:ubiquinone oxidoreductase [Candidatus Latescibacterota bacterium]
QMICKDDFGKAICYDDLVTGGSIMIFSPKRNILEIVHYFMEFFNEESCGYCTPCRVGNKIIINYLEKIMSGKGEPADIEYLEELCKTVKAASRCGLGQTSPNPVLTSLKNFRSEYDSLVHKNSDGMQPVFNIEEVLKVSEEICGRKSVHSHK